MFGNGKPSRANTSSAVPGSPPAGTRYSCPAESSTLSTTSWNTPTGSISSPSRQTAGWSSSGSTATAGDRHGRGEVGYEIPAGVCEPGETPEEAARRELLEETGFGGGTWHLNMVAAPNPSTSTNLCHSFIATGVHRLSGQHLEATEDIEVHLLYEDEVLRLMREGQIIQAPMLCSLWKYFAEKTSTTTV